MMIPILADATLPCLKEAFPEPFKLTTYQSPHKIVDLLPQQKVLITRSTIKVNQKLIGHHKLDIVATASSGSDHFDHDFLTERQIHMLDARGSNAHSVADYILSCLASLSLQNIFTGTTIGIIGVGAVGQLVYERLMQLRFNVILYDPVRALTDRNFQSAPLSELALCDAICIHANYHATPPYPSMHLINKNVLSKLKPRVIILNAARGGIVNELDLIHAIEQGQKIIYCTDVYHHEPAINPEIVALSTFCTPHIAGHSIEAKRRAVTMLSEKIHDFYQLPHPPFLKSEQASSIQFTQHFIANWQNIMLSHYDPNIETNFLKAADPTSMTNTFLNLRQQHSYRHDFNYPLLT